MLRIAACIMVPFVILFAGLMPGYLWATPLFVGSLVIMLVLFWGDYSERHLLSAEVIDE